MDVTEVVAKEKGGEASRSSDACPRCGESGGALPAVAVSSLGRVRVRRCPHCGTRFSGRESGERLLFSCERCGIPFLADKILPHGEHRCTDCAEGRIPPPLPEAAVAAATEREVRAALASRFKLLSSTSLQSYLDRIARHVADRIEGSPQGVEVLLFDDPGFRMLALPSGALLCSVGTLLFLEDEAELAFLLGHEIAHAASGDAAVRLVRLGFHAAIRGEDGQDTESWGNAALDLVRLGYGRRRERDADARAVDALVALGYDPESALRYLRRLQIRIEKGDPSVAELATSHPIPMDRIRRIERALYGRVKDDGVVKVNREVFRRVASRDSLTSTLLPRAWKEQAFVPASEPETIGHGPLGRLALAGAIALAVAGLIGVGWFLSR